MLIGYDLSQHKLNGDHSVAEASLNNRPKRIQLLQRVDEQLHLAQYVSLI